MQGYFEQIYGGDQGKSIIDDFLYLNFFNQFPIFLLGCYLYFSRKKIALKQHIFRLVVWILLATPFAIFLGKGKLNSGIGFLIVYCGIFTFTYMALKANISSKPLELLGKNSYSIYLCHFLVLELIGKTLRLSSGLLDFSIAITLTIIGSYLISMILKRLVEDNLHILAKFVTTS